tara:strand:+ start:354 stop:968 length:615 start_codon:yes stop_codon:yes gene_type:complete
LVILFLITIFYKSYTSNNKEVLRKIIHIGIGPLIPFAKFLEIKIETAQYLAGFISLMIILNYIYKLFPIIEDVDRKSYGTIFYCISLFILISIFWEKDPSALFVGVFIMTFGDGLAGLLGKNFKSKSWIIFNQKKSLLGTLTMLIVSTLVLVTIGYKTGYEFNLFYIFIAIISTILEQISILGIDNLIVPLISAIMFNLLITNI